MKAKIISQNKFKYIDEGSGIPIILLHGLMGSLSNFKSCVEELPKKGFRIIMPLLPIYELPLLKTSATELSNFLNQFIIELKPSKQLTPPKANPKRRTKGYLYEVREWGRNSAKWEAAKEYCAKKDMEFLSWPEKDLGL